jgi:hypothetical protein
MLSLKTDVNVPTERNEQKKPRKNTLFVGIFKPTAKKTFSTAYAVCYFTTLQGFPSSCE